MIGIVKLNRKLSEDEECDLKMAIRKMCTPSELIMCISDHDLEVDTSNLQEDFNAEQSAALQSSNAHLVALDGASGGLNFIPTVVLDGASGKLNISVGAIFKENSWNVPILQHVAVEAALKIESWKVPIIITNSQEDSDAEKFAASQPPTLLYGISAKSVASCDATTPTDTLPSLTAEDPPPDPPYATASAIVLGPPPPADPFLVEFVGDAAKPGHPPWLCSSISCSVCPAAPNYAKKLELIDMFTDEHDVPVYTYYLISV